MTGGFPPARPGPGVGVWYAFGAACGTLAIAMFAYRHIPAGVIFAFAGAVAAGRAYVLGQRRRGAPIVPAGFRARSVRRPRPKDPA